jgi:hypothetical protein
MTPEEKTNLEKRIQAAEEAENRCSRLSEALAGLAGAEADHPGVAEIRLVLDADGSHYPIQYRLKGSDRMEPLCWSREEPGLAAQIRVAIIAIVTERLGEAQNQFEAA